MHAPAYFCPAAHHDRVVLDTGEWSDAILTGRDGPETPEDGMGLRITYVGTGTIPSVTLNGPDGEIELVGQQEIMQATDALVTCNRLASGFGLPIPYHRWRGLQRGS
jgi:hypothetical protein